MSVEWKYMPVLKWKRGERAALQKLTADQREGVVPLAELQRRDDGSLPPNDEIAEHLKVSISEDGTVGIDTAQLLLPGDRPLDLLATLCTSVQKKVPDRQILPVIHGAFVTSLLFTSPKNQDLLKAFPEIILRLRSDQMTSEQIAHSVEGLRTAGFKKAAIHILIDQFSMVGMDPAPSATRIKPYLDAAIAQKCLSVTLAGGSFPVNLMGMKKGVSDLPRVEWQVWERVKKSAAYADVRFGDYTVTNPSRLPEIDPTQVNPSVSIRYAAKSFWRLFKGGGFKKGQPGTLAGLCALLVIDEVFSGEDFSDGDKRYADTAEKQPPANGIPWTWRRDATNHHIALTASEL